MIIGSVSENKNLEKRVSITPEIAKKYISLGFEIQLSENYGKHLGFEDKEYNELGVKLISDWGFRDDIPYGGWRKDQKAWMVNKDYSRKGAYYAVLKALYDAEQTKK